MASWEVVYNRVIRVIHEHSAVLVIIFGAESAGRSNAVCVKA